jgi:hypothetical protein
MFLRYVPKPLLTGILALLSLLLVAMPVASYAAPVARAATSTDAEDTAPPRSDTHTPTADGATTAADLIARADSPREVRAMRQLGMRLQQPCQEAKAAAEDDMNGTLWAVGGCLATVAALGAATFLKPEPPSSALMGKSDKYVAEYTDCYQEAGVSKRQRYALYGCLGGGLAYAGIYAIYAAAISSSV